MARVCEMGHVPHSCCHCRGSGVVQAVCDGLRSLPFAVEQREDLLGVHACECTQRLLHTQGTLEPAGNPRLFMLSSWLLPAVILLQQSHEHFTGCVHGGCSARCVWIFERRQKRSSVDRLPCKII